MSIDATFSLNFSTLSAVLGDASKVAADARAEARKLRREADAADRTADEASNRARVLRTQAVKSDATARTAELAGSFSATAGDVVKTVNEAGKPALSATPGAASSSEPQAYGNDGGEKELNDLGWHFHIGDGVTGNPLRSLVESKPCESCSARDKSSCSIR